MYRTMKLNGPQLSRQYSGISGSILMENNINFMMPIHCKFNYVLKYHLLNTYKNTLGDYPSIEEQTYCLKICKYCNDSEILIKLIGVSFPYDNILKRYNELIEYNKKYIEILAEEERESEIRVEMKVAKELGIGYIPHYLKKD